MNSWHNAALKYYAEGMSKADVARRIESEFGLKDMYNTVRCYIYKRRKKSGVLPNQISYLPDEEQAVQPAEKRVVIQNQEPEHYEGKWDGTQTLRFAMMGDTQFGSKYAQITHLHNFYDLCEREGINVKLRDVWQGCGCLRGS